MRDIAQVATHDPTDDQAPTPAQRAQREAQRVAADWRWQMSTPQGRRVVWQILAMTGLHRTSFTGNSETFFREGQRDIGLRVESSVVQHWPEYILMLQENHAS